MQSRTPFASMCVLFFVWGFLMTWNDLLIPRFRDVFQLNFFRAMLVQFAFSGGYAVGSALYYVCGVLFGDPLSRIGFKNGILAGLALAGLGSGMFVPAAMTASYGLFLCALCLIGLGFSMIQIAANPYVLALGPEKTGSSRLNLAAGFSSVGTTLGPLIGGWLIFRVFAHAGEPSLNTVRGPYLICAAGFGLLILLFSRLRLPQLNSAAPVARSWGPLAIPAVWLSVLAVFFYVGTEVTIGSSIVNFLGLPAIAGMTHDEASRSLSIYWCGLMAGRFMGAAALSGASPRAKRATLALIPATALLAVNIAFGWQSALHYALCLVLLVAAFVTGGLSSARLLMLFSVAVMLLLGLGIWTSGATARWAILGTGLFCSIMWSNIFSLALEGLGPLKNQTSALLVMAISGAAILPPLQGAFADRWGMQASFLVPLLAMAYVAVYACYKYRSSRLPHAQQFPA
jgi:FHS family L-fucose permease-like MFS transporter